MLLVRPEALIISPKVAKTRAGGPRHCKRKVPTAELEQVGDTHQAIDMGPGPALLISNIVVAPCVTLKVKRTDVGFGAVAHHKRCARGRENISKIKSARGNSVKDSRPLSRGQQLLPTRRWQQRRNK